MSEIAIRDSEEIAPVTLFRSDNPREIIHSATAIANELLKVVKKQGLTSKIQGKDFPRVEAWTLCGTLLGVFPVLEWSRPVEGGWEARVEARTLAGQIVGAAEAQCLRGERAWASRDDYALRSMAQTRATSKALRQPLGFVMTLAGFEATPAEEMTFDADYEVTSDVPVALAPNPDEHPDRPGLVADILALATVLGKRDAKEQEIAAKRGTPNEVTWLRSQLSKAQQAVTAMQAGAS